MKIKSTLLFHSVLLFSWLLITQNACSQNKSKTSIKKPDGIWAVAWNPTNNYIAIGGDDSILYLYNSKNYSLYKSFRANSMIKGMNWHPDGKILAIANMKGVQLFDITTEKLSTLEHITTGGRAIGWNHNGQLLGLADGRGILQIMNKEGQVLKSIPKHNNHSYLTIDWHPSKNVIVAASDDIVVFDTSGKQYAFIKHRKEHTGVLTAKWHPSGDFFATGDYGHENEGIPTLLQFWKHDGTLLKEMKGSKAEYRNISWNKDGSQLATASDALRVWTKDGVLIDSGKRDYNLWGISWNPANDLIVTTNFGSHVDLWTIKAKLVKQIE
jgi:WD40 repeat protein